MDAKDPTQQTGYAALMHLDSDREDRSINQLHLGSAERVLMKLAHSQDAASHIAAEDIATSIINGNALTDRLMRGSFIHTMNLEFLLSGTRRLQGCAVKHTRDFGVLVNLTGKNGL